MNLLRKLRAVSDGTERGVGEAATEPASPISLTLPMPPSVNEMFRNVPGKGRVKTGLYLDWRGHAAWSIRAQKPGSIRGAVLAIVSVERGSASADIDNRIKAIFDILVACDVIEDDRFIVGFCAAWAPASSRLARVMVLPAASLSFDFQLASDGATGGWFMQAPQPENADGAHIEGPQD